MESHQTTTLLCFWSTLSRPLHSLMQGRLPAWFNPLFGSQLEAFPSGATSFLGLPRKRCHPAQRLSPRESRRTSHIAFGTNVWRLRLWSHRKDSPRTYHQWRLLLQDEHWDDHDTRKCRCAIWCSTVAFCVRMSWKAKALQTLSRPPSRSQGKALW